MDYFGVVAEPELDPVGRVVPMAPDEFAPELPAAAPEALPLVPLPLVPLPLMPLRLMLPPVVPLPDPIALPLVPPPAELVPLLFDIPAVECDVLLLAWDLDFDLLELLCLVLCGLVVLALAEPVPLFTAALVPDGLELVALAPDGLELVALAPEPFAVAVLPPAVVGADPLVLPDVLWASATPPKHASAPAIRRYESLRFIAWILSCRP